MNIQDYHSLSQSEIEQLKNQGNRAEDWNTIFVKNGFTTEDIFDNFFLGTIYLGSHTCGFVENGDLRIPTGISHCWLQNCTIGDDTTMHNVRMIANYRVGDHCLLFNIDEMTCSSNYAWIEPMNECGGRRILPFKNMTVGDAYFWAKYRDHENLMKKLEAMTVNTLSSEEGSCGQVGDYCVIKNIKHLHNVTINSDSASPSAITDCIALTDGMVGFGCHLEMGCIAQRFLLGEHVHLEYGVRLNDAVVGDNSTIARCEVGCSIIFPAHEQHHNNSFLIASVIMGQSNVAAGSTIGSNHNGRTADNEIVAGRGFWPGLCSSFKHSSTFASYSLLAKGSYPNELNITLPFSLVSNNTAKNQLEVMPAYWWLYNMYALNRNEKKFAARDKRVKKCQHIVFDPLAPDTAEEIVCGRELLRYWTEQAYLHFGTDKDHVEVTASNMEKGHRKVVVLKAAKGYEAYEEMLIYYAMKSLLRYRNEDDTSLPDSSLANHDRERCWVNLGGQLLRQRDLDKLIADIENDTLSSWDAIHQRLDDLWTDYPQQLMRHAYHLLCEMNGCKEISQELWNQLLARYTKIQQYVAEQVRITREKDEHNPFRRMTYRNDAEMAAVLNS